jgi:hypothetical protein
LLSALFGTVSTGAVIVGPLFSTLSTLPFVFGALLGLVDAFAHGAELLT